jgi:hypothetical protein
MKIRHLQSKIGRGILGFALLFGIGAASLTTTQAQYRNNDDQYRREQDRRAQDRDGQYQRDDQYRRDQDRDRNRDNDRRGRRRGGRGGDDYPNYGGSFQLRQTALNAGYNEGIKAGRNDHRKGDRYDFRDEGAYQKATKDYNSRDGDRELYRRYFRMAFENGYDAGYNGY